MNSKLAQAHIAAENRLTISEILALCGTDRMAESDPGLCFLGADVGSLIHCVIGKRHPDKAGQIIHVASFPDWNHLNNLMKRFNVSKAVIDALAFWLKGITPNPKSKTYAGLNQWFKFIILSETKCKDCDHGFIAR